jgi:hypothetical protein
MAETHWRLHGLWIAANALVCNLYTVLKYVPSQLEKIRYQIKLIHSWLALSDDLLDVMGAVVTIHNHKPCRLIMINAPTLALL